MNETLQKRIDEAKQKEYPLPPMVDGVVCKVLAMSEQTAYNKGAAFALRNQWVSVEEALPPLDDGMESVSIEVVVKNEYGKATCAWYSYITNTWHLSYGEIAGDDLIDSKITHWMEIPIVQISARE